VHANRVLKLHFSDFVSLFSLTLEDPVLCGRRFAGGVGD
jgi:hypothetical protein